MLSDYEQRALEELERRYGKEAREPVPPGPESRRSARRTGRTPGIRVLVVLGCASIGLLIVGVAAAALALATATAMGRLFWRLWSRRADSEPIAAPPAVEAGMPKGGTEHRWGASVRNYLEWLSEAE